MDRLRAYEVFTTVVAKNGFARAADALDTSPANVTRYVAELEAHLGARLLNRTSRRLSLTEAGAALYERLRHVLDDVAEAEAAASADSRAPRGRLRINAPLSFGVRHLAPLWPRFMVACPDVELDISLSDRVVDLVDEGYDLAIRISRGGSQSHVARKLALSHNIVCAAPSYVAAHGAPASPDDLMNHACVAYTLSPEPEEWPFLDAHGQAYGAPIRPRFSSNNGDTVRAMALSGHAMAWLPTFLAGEDLRAGRLVRVMPDYPLPPIAILAVYPSRRHLSAKVRAMVDFLADAFNGTPDWERDTEA
ncbi:LysR family transcriptional regulator [Novosphingobium humi]|uniref:LysR family transcriptional regulator n=1 Tax=Novosphingobium humi TaxID=2282397 RepID=A0ABY7U4J1_9SPHN|nr:LysR family transcriptional regulator [Novosphingobium humi]WCT80123.1 LysR family transcriptional regulator [Novosphingobium humi]